MKQFGRFKFSHLTNEPKREDNIAPVRYTNSHPLLYGTTGCGKSDFLKHHLDQNKTSHLVLGRDENQLHENNVPLLHLENINFDSFVQ